MYRRFRAKLVIKLEYEPELNQVFLWLIQMLVIRQVQIWLKQVNQEKKIRTKAKLSIIKVNQV